MANRAIPSVAIIGSYRRHYRKIGLLRDELTSAGVEVTSPLPSAIAVDGVPFVRLAADHPRYSDDQVQTRALHRILRADMVYVVAPNGYVGRTTCYELGRIIQAGHALYFSSLPRDLPVHVPRRRVIPPSLLVRRLRERRLVPTPLRSSPLGRSRVLERDLIAGHFHDGI